MELLSCVFPVLIDTGCSMACTGFKDDFDGTLVPGEFGSIKTANGTASIQGFGLISWHTVSEEGTPLVVRVPAHYAPNIQLCLFSPQDYAKYRKQPAELATMLGSHAWFAFIHEASTNGLPLVIHSNINPQSHLFLFYADTKPLSECPDKAQCSAHAHNVQFMLDEDNANLSSAQKSLLLDHQ